MSRCLPRRSSVVVASLALVALAAQLPAQTSRFRVSLPGYDTPFVLDSAGVRTDMLGTPARVFHAARLALTELGVPPAVADSAHGVLLNPRFQALRKLGDKRLSTYVNCGVGLTGARADEYRVTMAVSVIVEPHPEDKERARVRVAVGAGAQDITGQTTEPIPCPSTGALEKQVRLAMTKQLLSR